jgi:hypothetical protein
MKKGSIMKTLLATLTITISLGSHLFGAMTELDKKTEAYWVNTQSNSAQERICSYYATKLISYEDALDQDIHPYRTLDTNLIHTMINKFESLLQTKCHTTMVVASR